MSLLTTLKARGKKIAVVSNKFYDATRSLCKNYFGDLIDVAVGEREDIRKKPAPDLINEAFRQLGVAQNEALSAVYVGDSDVDIETAHNSGLPCISVLWGFRDRTFLLAHGATTFVSKPEEILP
ncbi:MAG: HAD family hydrolase, partial [Prevotella sp.]|nr:HAD family hydrolase [Prevotella sp.]